MNSNTAAAILLGMISATAFTVIIYWWTQTRGTWRKYPAGRSLMGLLGIIAIGFGFGVVNRLLGQYEARDAISFVLYIGFFLALVAIGVAVRKELRRGRERRHQPPTGPITVIVAEEVKDEDNV